MIGGSAQETDLARYTFTYPVTIGELHPSEIPSRESAERGLAKQIEFLNRCLKTGRIIAKTQSSGVFAVGDNGEHQLITASVTFIVGFTRRPYWLAEAPPIEEPTPKLEAVRGSG